MAGRASGIAMMSPPHAWKPTPRPDPAVQRGPRPMSCGRRDRLSTLPNGPDSNSKRNANDCRTTPREGLKQTPPRTPATGHGNAHVCVEPSKGSAISRTRGGEFPYRFERKKRQSFRRGHTTKKDARAKAAGHDVSFAHDEYPHLPQTNKNDPQRLKLTIAAKSLSIAVFGLAALGSS